MNYTIRDLMAPQRALPSAETLRETVRRRADEERIWTGLSGETLTGDEVAQHLTAAREWLAECGWAPRDGRGITAALTHTAPGGDGDKDTRIAAEKLLGLILQARANLTRWVDVEAWESRTHRTHAQVAQLMRQAADIARDHAPRGGA